MSILTYIAEWIILVIFIRLAAFVISYFWTGD